MIKRRSVLILGAGASKPYGFPLGNELRDEVIKLSGNSLYDFVFDQSGAPKGYAAKFANELSRSGFSSADAFIENRPEWMLIGKIAMAISLLVLRKIQKIQFFLQINPKTIGTKLCGL